MSGQDSKDHTVIKAMWEVFATVAVVVLSLVGFGVIAHLAMTLVLYGWRLV